MAGQARKALEAAKSAADLGQQNGYAWLSFGVMLSKQGERENAIRALTRACELQPESGKAFYSLGVAYDLAGRHDEAVQACRRATVLSPYEPIAWRNLGIALDKARHPGGAVEALERALELDESDVATWISLGRAYVTNGQADQGFEVLKRALAIDPDSIDAHRSLAISLGNAGRSEEAIAAWKALAARTGEAADWHVLSVAYRKAGRHVDAITAAEKALTIDPESLDPLRSLAINLGYAGRSEKAIAAWKALAERTGEAADWRSLSMAYYRAGWYRRGAEVAQRATEIDAKHVEAWEALSINLDQLGESQKALEARARADQLIGETRYDDVVESASETISHKPESLEAWQSLAASLKQLGDPKRAILLAQNILESKPSLHCIVLPIVDELMNQMPTEVAALLRLAIEQEPESATYWHLLSVAERRSGEIDSALVAGVKSVELDSDKPNFWYALGRTYEDADLPEDARKAYEKAVRLEPAYAKALQRLKDLQPGW